MRHGGLHDDPGLALTTYPKGTRVVVTEQRAEGDARPGEYLVDQEAHAPGFDIPGIRYWLTPIPEDGGAYPAPVDVVELAPR